MGTTCVVEMEQAVFVTSISDIPAGNAHKTEQKYICVCQVSLWYSCRECAQDRTKVHLCLWSQSLISLQGMRTRQNKSTLCCSKMRLPQSTDSGWIKMSSTVFPLGHCSYLQDLVIVRNSSSTDWMKQVRDHDLKLLPVMQHRSMPDSVSISFTHTYTHNTRMHARAHTHTHTPLPVSSNCNR